MKKIPRFELVFDISDLFVKDRPGNIELSNPINFKEKNYFSLRKLPRQRQGKAHDSSDSSWLHPTHHPHQKRTKERIRGKTNQHEAAGNWKQIGGRVCILSGSWSGASGAWIPSYRTNNCIIPPSQLLPRSPQHNVIAEYHVLTRYHSSPIHLSQSRLRSSTPN